jgi:hypothetical protein
MEIDTKESIPVGAMISRLQSKHLHFLSFSKNPYSYIQLWSKKETRCGKEILALKEENDICTCKFDCVIY